MRIWILFTVLFLAGCAGTSTSPTDDAPLVLKAASFSDLPGWRDDKTQEAAPALQKSCARILKNSADKKFGPLHETGTYAAWQTACRNIKGAANLKTAIEQNFTPYLVTAGGNPEGLFIAI